jgi:hypothetical protein
MSCLSIVQSEAEKKGPLGEAIAEKMVLYAIRASVLVVCYANFASLVAPKQARAADQLVVRSKLHLSFEALPIGAALRPLC